MLDYGHLLFGCKSPFDSSGDDLPCALGPSYRVFLLAARPQNTTVTSTRNGSRDKQPFGEGLRTLALSRGVGLLQVIPSWRDLRHLQLSAAQWQLGSLRCARYWVHLPTGHPTADYAIMLLPTPRQRPEVNRGSPTK
jgi:hypothetical protein